ANQWDANNGRGQTTYFMQRLVENLPPAEREYLASRKASILDWGCAFGDGVKVLAETFPRCRVAGLDFAERAVAEARRCFPRHDFRYTSDGSIGDHFDVIICSHCLEHFSDPLQVLQQHLRCCRGFYALLVPHKESPLNSTHLTQFRKECFPERLGGFTRVAAEVMDSDPTYWSGQMLLVVYASASYLRGREGIEIQIREREKWDNYYATLPMLEIDDAMRDFGDDLAERIGELLPRGGKVLEAGCGAGWQSLALAQKGRFQLTLMDFSSEALGYAERIFAQHQLSAEFVDGDVFSCGEPQFDLVFNAGVLEHYNFDQQVAFLRGMASRSTKYVLALVPNRMCYWYWLWRMQRSARGGWPFGKEMPMADMSAAFEAAGLSFLGHWFGGETWSEFFIKDLDGIDGQLRDELLAVHRSPIVPEKQRAYLVAALGCKGNVAGAPSCWETASGSSDFTLDQLTASLADSLAAVVAAEHRCKQLNAVVADKDKLVATGGEACESLRVELHQRSDEIVRLCGKLADVESHSEAAKELAVLKRTRGYHLLLWFWRIRTLLAPPGSRRAKMGLIARKPLSWAASLAPRSRQAGLRCLRGVARRLAPDGTSRGRCVRTTVEKVRRLRRRTPDCSEIDLDQVLRENRQRRGIVVYPPFIDWSWMRQRPHHLMSQFAKAGYLSLFCSPQRHTDSFQGFVPVAERLYLCDDPGSLFKLSGCLLLTAWSGWETVTKFHRPVVIYDYLDDLGVAESWASEQYKLGLHRKLVATSQVVLATARRLHEEVAQQRPDALYCPNGVDYEHFHLNVPPSPPADIADLVNAGRPIIGYYGALARWFDYELVARAATIRKDWAFLLIGPDFDQSLAVHNLAALPNVRWLGEKKYEELPAYLHYFSVATIPFLINDITKATSPVKLFEYMAATKPIVTTDMPECRSQPCVIVARDAVEYAAMLEEAMHRGKSESYRRTLDQTARANTWEARMKQIINQLDALDTEEHLRSA
ncbi:MAG: methyltransferase domain-containing protein, partial [Planctomycetes bacterium]|nr:methyltransferase domain-containing protein [Planctomycetota bacterium]